MLAGLYACNAVNAADCWKRSSAARRLGAAAAVDLAETAPPHTLLLLLPLLL
jgi:hypothetical protein